MKRLLAFALVLCTGFSGFAQVEAPQPSPLGKMEQKVGLTDITLEYSRPATRGRTIFGDLVPFNKVWRTGANLNTIITFSDDVKIGGKELAKGSYAIYTKPQKDQWTVMFYETTNNWGVPQEWDDSKVALTATAAVEEMPFKMETFTIVIDELKSDAANLNFLWENTVAILEIEVPTDNRTMASIDKVMNGPTAQDYFSAASYYHEAGKDMDKAYSWVKKANEMSEGKAYWMLRRQSLIEAEMGKTKEAIATAKKSLSAAEAANNADYVKMNKESIAEWEAK